MSTAGAVCKRLFRLNHGGNGASTGGEDAPGAGLTGGNSLKGRLKSVTAVWRPVCTNQAEKSLRKETQSERNPQSRLQTACQRQDEIHSLAGRYHLRRVPDGCNDFTLRRSSESRVRDGY